MPGSGDDLELFRRTTSYFYDLDGNIVRRSFPNGITELRDYNARNWLTSSKVRGPTGVMQCCDNLFEPNGNLGSQLDKVLDHSHTQIRLFAVDM